MPHIETQRTAQIVRSEPADPRSLERGVRQLLADKVSGSMVGIWLLVPEHLRLGTWDLLSGWTARPTPCVEPRLALQMVHEAALCVAGMRRGRSLSQKGFELANGLPFIASDPAIHGLLAERSVADTQSLQVALGHLRRASGHYHARLLAIDPHRTRSYSRRQMRRRRGKRGTPARKMAQTFFCLDLETAQPVAMTTATAACSVGRATPGLLAMAADILGTPPGQCLVLADNEHFCADLIDTVHRDTPFDLLVPLPSRKPLDALMAAVPPEQFIPRWAGYATTTIPYQLTKNRTGPHHLFIQRSGERPEEHRYKGFLCTAPRDEAHALTVDYPQRWHLEEFFNTTQALGWNRAGTQNLNIRYAQMTLALFAQAAIAQLRKRLPTPLSTWDADHLARDLFLGLDGDIRVCGDTVVITYYNAPDAHRLRAHYEGLPGILEREGTAPHVPWLYGLKLDFRFR